MQAYRTKENHSFYREVSLAGNVIWFHGPHEYIPAGQLVFEVDRFEVNHEGVSDVHLTVVDTSGRFAAFHPDDLNPLA